MWDVREWSKVEWGPLTERAKIEVWGDLLWCSGAQIQKYQIWDAYWTSEGTCWSRQLDMHVWISIWLSSAFNWYLKPWNWMRAPESWIWVEMVQGLCSYHHLRGFLFTIPSSWNTVSPNSCVVYLLHVDLCLIFTLERVMLWPLYLEGSLSLSHLTSRWLYFSSECVSLPFMCICCTCLFV